MPSLLESKLWKKANMKLVLFLTYGGSLKSWSEFRIIERELALYRDHVWAGYTIHVISYGSAKEEKELVSL